MQPVHFFKQIVSKKRLSTLIAVLLFSLSLSTAFGQTDNQTILKIKKSKSQTSCNSEMSSFDGNLLLGKPFFLTLDLEEFGDIENLAINVSIDKDTNEVGLFTGNIGGLTQNDRITLPIYLNLDLSKGNALIKVHMEFHDSLGNAYTVSNRVNTYLQ